jgi:alkanesulfonate monooxygenase SsuD/methylene tetrahydromethanopterin reductase-like flavin-dependent oxidoreductase (luciferase family)
VKLGLTLPSFVEDPEIPLVVARAADAAGLDGVFVYDHLFRLEGGTRRPALEGVSLLGAVAAATSKVAVGSLVFRAWLRPPASLAAAIATAVRIAPGRTIAAIGAGDSQSREENESFGLGFGTMQDRVEALRAAVMAAQDAGARLWVGGHAKSVREVAAVQAHGWNAWGGDVDQFASQVEETRAMGARPDFECTWGGLLVLAEDDARARAKAERLGASDQVIVGGPATVAAALARYGAVGADWVIVAPLDSRDPENVHLLAEQVKPLLGP